MNATSSKFSWHPQPEPAAWIARVLRDALAMSPALEAWRNRLLKETGTRLSDWVDEVSVEATTVVHDELTKFGFQQVMTHATESVWRHPAAMLPFVRLRQARGTRVVMKVENVSDFVMVAGLGGRATVTEPPGSVVRSAKILRENAVELCVRERHGLPWDESVVELARVHEHREQFSLRPRGTLKEADAFAALASVIEQAKQDLGASYTCDLFFYVERQYWQARNTAARVQKARQDALGLGWGNHDHHTFRSSRAHYAALIGALEALGMHCRENFHAGLEAGWGAQVLEHDATGILVFADVDLSPEELDGDFAHEGLGPSDRVGTIGLWCALHGEAILQAGMHHLEAQFSFDAVTSQLAELGVQRMRPFTEFPHLRQAFTVAERWQVAAGRIEQARTAGLIDQKQAETFASNGALGSHLELLERNDGYKGFNQTGISAIIRRTDPRES